MTDKKFVDVTAKHSRDGKVKLLSITWEDGKEYSVDRVLDVRMAAALKAGGQGMRYTCRIHGREVYLFFDEGRFFIES
ncbi:hypothetical protein EV210_101185 [Anaerospora hongkongensis]|uniref:Uncharacterized protein n=1 Tax=Anaerospora hongkongensis TaxID=244830 RepID=A0A4R1QAN4_9FIRM|nr:hypothetical protein [Anaerospora hongkongensis]TCL39985.1 hypothetical protein EV210_101185 [Anaerospora hongkongensis]